MASQITQIRASNGLEIKYYLKLFNVMEDQQIKLAK